MTSMHLLDAVGRIDDELLLEARNAPRRGQWLRWGAVAAALALCVGLAGLVGRSGLLSRKAASAPAQYADEAETANSPMAPAAAENSRGTASSGGAVNDTLPAAGAPASVADVCKPVFWVDGTPYRIVEFQVDELPEGCVPLGELEFSRTAAAKNRAPLVNDEETAGRRAWLSPEGELFIDFGSGYARAAAANTPES